MNDIPLTSSKDYVVQQLGAPLQETLRDGNTILWYGSKYPDSATFYYFQNDTLVRISKSVLEQKKPVQVYVEGNNLPELSFHRYDATVVEDTLPPIVHVWPEKGIAIIAYGIDATSIVEREEYFKSGTIEEYFQTAGADFAGHEIATVAGVVQNVRFSNQINKNSMGTWPLVAAFLVTLLAVVFWRLRRKGLLPQEKKV